MRETMLLWHRAHSNVTKTIRYSGNGQYIPELASHEPVRQAQILQREIQTLFTCFSSVSFAQTIFTFRERFEGGDDEEEENRVG